MLQVDLGMAYRAIGDYPAAKIWYGKALETWKKRGVLTWQSNLLNSLGVLYQIEGEYTKAVQCLEEAMDQARRSGFPHTQALVYASLGDVYAELEDRELAGQAYRHAESYARQTNDRFLLHYAITARAGLARACGDYEKARDLLGEIRASVARSHSNYEQGLYQLEFGRLEVCSGQAARAIEHLLASLDLLARGNLVLEQGLCRLWLAAAYLRQEELAAAASQIKQLGELFKNKDYPRSLCLAAYQLRDWMVDLKHDAGAHAVLKQLFQVAESTSSDFSGLRRRIRHLARSVSVLPAQVQIKGLGRSNVHINGKLVTSSQWKTREVKELFFFFVCYPRPMTKEEVGTILWPELSAQQLKLRFKNDIYRLRQAVGPNAILFELKDYRFNRAMDYTFDLEAFEAGLFNARISRDSREKIQYLKSAVELVRGRFLEDLDATWLLSERERLEQEYLNALLDLAGLEFKEGLHAEALQACQRALRWDNCFEPAHCLAMRIYASIGDRAAVAAQFRSLQQVLEKQLGVPPQKETEELYNLLTA
jgi:two-component SAPR family response regulator